MVTLDKVMELQKQGLSETQISTQLQNEGVSPQEINNSLNQAKIKPSLHQNKLLKHPRFREHSLLKSPA